MSIDKRTLPYYTELIRLRSFLERKVEDFPRFKCDQTTRMIHLITGLEEVSGRYVPDEDRHTWNYDADRKLFVDLTQDQYPHRGKIVVMPASTPLLRLEDKAMREYQSSLGSKTFQMKISKLLGAYLINQSTQHHHL
jgi:hypothetical protein